MKKSFVLIMILTLVILLVSCDLNFPGSLMDGIPTEPSAPTESEERTNPIEHPQHTESSEPANPTESTKTTEPAVHEHSFGDWVITKHPTTTETGLRERSCSCGEKETETIPVVESGLEFEFSSEHNGYFVTGKGTNRDVDLVIPSEYNGYPVVGIAHEAFYMNVYAKSITIPDSVKYIENEAFIYAEMLESVYMSDSVVLIEYGAFSECLSLKTVRLSNSLEALPERLFKNSKKLEEVNIPDSVKTIGGEAFYECVALKSISFPRGLKEIGGYAFYKCKSLASDLLIPDGVEEIGLHTFQQCESVKNVRLPASLKSIGEYAFDGCSSLEQVVMEEGTALEKLDEYAFSDCVKLQIFNFENASTAEAQFVIPDTLTSIGDGAFMDCPITCAITIPAKVKDIGRGAFYGTKIPEIYFAIKDGWKRWQVINQGVAPSFFPVSVLEVSDPVVMAEKMTKTDTRAMRLFEN